MTDSDSDGDENLGNMFTEPDRPPSPEPTLAMYTREIPDGSNHSFSGMAEGEPTPTDRGWTKIDIRLIGAHSLWGHHLWNASRALATYLDGNGQFYRNRSVLELGAGGGLPGIVCAKNGAGNVVLTDYPDEALLKNLLHNCVINGLTPSPSDQLGGASTDSLCLSNVHVEGYIWGRAIRPLLDHLQTSLSSKHHRVVPGEKKFDLIIMSDLIFNHSQHEALLETASLALSSPHTSPTQEQTNTQPCVLVFYTHHRPHLAHRDLAFFDLARERGWVVEEVLTRKFEPMFPEDSGDEGVRSTVHGWRLTRAAYNGQANAATTREVVRRDQMESGITS